MVGESGGAGTPEPAASGEPGAMPIAESGSAKELASIPMFVRALRGVRAIVSVNTFPLSPVCHATAELQPKLVLLKRREALSVMVVT